MRRFQTTWVIPALLLLPLACNGGAAAPVPPRAPPSASVPTPPAPAAVPAATPATAFTCCGDDAAGAVVGAYLGAQAALAKDDNAGAGAALTTLQAGLEAAKAQPGLDEAGKGVLAAIATESGAALAATELEPRRAAFKKLSAAVIPFARAHAGGSRSVTEAFCPMASASWLQEGGTIANPYYGSSMLTCGSFK
ncbi:MAG: hypothetical protein Q8P18_07100 [Pseudomonadota bacterium]|nr:hypothetical protein [Pseudomonadota bacterium]